MQRDAYHQWIETIEAHDRIDVHFSRPAEMTGELRYGVLAPGPWDAAQLGRMVDGLIAQDNLCWELVFPAGRESKLHRLAASYCSDVQDRLVAVDCGPESDRGAILRRLLGASQADWCFVVDPDDILIPSTLGELDIAVANAPGATVIYCDEDELTSDGRRINPRFKPGHSPQMLQSYNYFGRLTVFRRDAGLAVGGFTAGQGAGAEWSLNLRLSDAASTEGGPIIRLPLVLCHSPAGRRRDRPDPASHAAAQCRDVLVAHWQDLGIIDPRVTTQADGTQRSTWAIDPKPLVSIIIPNHNNLDLLQRCIDGLVNLTSYENFEIIVVENNSTDNNLFDYYDKLRKSSKVIVVEMNAPFNYSAVCNRGVQTSRGDLLLFLNNDIEVVDADWLTEMVRVATLPGVGVVGIKLNYPDGTLQHAGVGVGIHLYSLLFNGAVEHRWGVFGSPNQTRNCMAIMGACQMVRSTVFQAVGRFDESYRIANSDVALCLRAYKAGWQIAFTPFAELIHHEGKTRGHLNPPEDMVQAALELHRLDIREDPFLHPQLGTSDTALRLIREGERSISENLVFLQSMLCAGEPSR